MKRQTQNSCDASNTFDKVSVVGNKVFVGNGSTADHIGTIDGTLDGENGKTLRINIEEPSLQMEILSLANDLEGWTLETSRAF